MPHSSVSPAAIVVLILVVAYGWKLLSAPSEPTKKKPKFWNMDGSVNKYYRRWPR